MVQSITSLLKRGRELSRQQPGYEERQRKKRRSLDALSVSHLKKRQSDRQNHSLVSLFSKRAASPTKRRETLGGSSKLREVLSAEIPLDWSLVQGANLRVQLESPERAAFLSNNAAQQTRAKRFLKQKHRRTILPKAATIRRNPLASFLCALRHFRYPEAPVATSQLRQFTRVARLARVQAFAEALRDAVSTLRSFRRVPRDPDDPDDLGDGSSDSSSDGEINVGRCVTVHCGSAVVYFLCRNNRFLTAVTCSTANTRAALRQRGVQFETPMFDPDVLDLDQADMSKRHRRLSIVDKKHLEERDGTAAALLLCRSLPDLQQVAQYVIDETHEKVYQGRVSTLIRCDDVPLVLADFDFERATEQFWPFAFQRQGDNTLQVKLGDEARQGTPLEQVEVQDVPVDVSSDRVHTVLSTNPFTGVVESSMLRSRTSGVHSTQHTPAQGSRVKREPHALLPLVLPRVSHVLTHALGSTVATDSVATDGVATDTSVATSVATDGVASGVTVHARVTVDTASVGLSGVADRPLLRSWSLAEDKQVHAMGVADLEKPHSTERALRRTRRQLAQGSDHIADLTQPRGFSRPRGRSEKRFRVTLALPSAAAGLQQPRMPLRRITGGIATIG